MKYAREDETTRAGHARSVEVLVGVRIVKCHAIVDVLCHAVILVAIGVHVLLLRPHLLLPTLCPNSHTVLDHPTLSRSHSFSNVFHCILTAFEVWYLHPRRLQ